MSAVPPVDRAALLAHLYALAGERHPVSSPDRLAAAQQYVEQRLREAGLSVSHHAFTMSGRLFENVLGSPPAARPGPRLIIGAHFDCVQGTPGADDNASGVAVLLEAARIVTQARPEAAVTWAGFNLEEQGMLGSSAYVAELAQRKAPIRGMLSLEMIGFTGPAQDYPPLLKPFYPTVGNFIGLVGTWKSRSLLMRCSDAMRSVPGLPVETISFPGNGGLVPESRLSDHAPFWDAGYPALLVTDTSFFRNPHYHQATDTIETLNLTFLARVCQGVAEAAVRIAG